MKALGNYTSIGSLPDLGVKWLGMEGYTIWVIIRIVLAWYNITLNPIRVSYCCRNHILKFNELFIHHPAVLRVFWLKPKSMSGTSPLIQHSWRLLRTVLCSLSLSSDHWSVIQNELRVASCHRLVIYPAPIQLTEWKYPNLNN